MRPSTRELPCVDRGNVAGGTRPLTSRYPPNPHMLHLVRQMKSEPGQALFGIVQGGTDRELRQRSADALVALDLPGYAVGGLAVGEGQELMLAMLDHTLPHLPGDKPRYLMGVGTPTDLIEAVARGIDMFDCVIPTHSGRHGQAFTWNGRVNLRNARSTRKARARPAAITRARICIISSSRASISARCCCRGPTPCSTRS